MGFVKCRALLSTKEEPIKTLSYTPVLNGVAAVTLLVVLIFAALPCIRADFVLYSKWSARLSVKLRIKAARKVQVRVLLPPLFRHGRVGEWETEGTGDCFRVSLSHAGAAG